MGVIRYQTLSLPSILRAPTTALGIQSTCAATNVSICRNKQLLQWNLSGHTTTTQLCNWQAELQTDATSWGKLEAADVQQFRRYQKSWLSPCVPIGLQNKQDSWKSSEVVILFSLRNLPEPTSTHEPVCSVRAAYLKKENWDHTAKSLIIRWQRKQPKTSSPKHQWTSWASIPRQSTKIPQSTLDERPMLINSLLRI